MEIIRGFQPYRIFHNESGQVVIRQDEPNDSYLDMWVLFDPLQINQLIADLKAIQELDGPEDENECGMD